MPDEMNLQHEDVLPNDQLSDHDKAFMVINYPRSSVDPTATGLGQQADDVLRQMRSRLQ